MRPSSTLVHVLPLVGILFAPAGASADVSPTAPPALMREFFHALHDHNIYYLEHYLTTADFHIFEGNISFSKAGWFKYVRSKSTEVKGVWNLTDFVVSVDEKSAHVYYDDRAVFTNTSSGQQTRHHWIESAYMVMDDERLKIKFISSTSVNL